MLFHQSHNALPPSYAPHKPNPTPPAFPTLARPRPILRIGLRAAAAAVRLAVDCAVIAALLAAWAALFLAPGLPPRTSLPSPLTNGAINSFNCSGLFSIKIVKILICSAGENSCRFSDIILRLRLFLLSVVTLYFLRILFN